MKSPPGTIEIFLQPGDFYFGDSSTRIRTLLGSCVSITMWHPMRLIGGMCHFMLPGRRVRTAKLQGKYADEAIELFLRQIAAHKTSPRDYQVKIFGGGHMFPSLLNQHSGSIAIKNVSAAQTLLAKHNLSITSTDVSGVGHRSLFFEIWNGHVWVKQQPLAGSAQAYEND